MQNEVGEGVVTEREDETWTGKMDFFFIAFR